jgi:hypothetical protein
MLTCQHYEVKKGKQKALMCYKFVHAVHCNLCVVALQRMHAVAPQQSMWAEAELNPKIFTTSPDHHHGRARLGGEDDRNSRALSSAVYRIRAPILKNPYFAQVAEVIGFPSQHVERGGGEG